MQEMYIIGLKQALLEAYNGLPGKPDLTKICCENIPIAKSWSCPFFSKVQAATAKASLRSAKLNEAERKKSRPGKNSPAC